MPKAGETQMSNLTYFVTLLGQIVFPCFALAASPSTTKSCPASREKVPSLNYDEAIVTEKSPFLTSRVYSPKDNRKHLSIVMLHGSEGGSAGFISSEAKAIAAKGYNVMTLCYFDCDPNTNRPFETLKEVPVSLVFKAIKWMREQPNNDGKVVIYGLSRGAELTMIAGSLNPKDKDAKPDALIAHSPSDTFNQPYNASWDFPQCWLCKTHNCGKHSPKKDSVWNPKCGPDEIDRVDWSKSAWVVNGKTVRAGKRIPIEKFSGPVLITVGDQDDVWPVAQTRRIEKTLKEAGKAPEVYYFPKEKHVFDHAALTCRDRLVTTFLDKVDGPAGSIEMANDPEAAR
jgi:dienelactone hydrolase